ncbi:hypothetical protein Y032_0046g1419 [Ancylostoma ceylanicum]|uniref:Uncharacterized protein n=1 Tax=Ancylostoma ceylanicum TaxID=53326 RepID=A0A016UBR8_9BILA|nr:hypothetical protein Y032_0046g1419 [Ancylostoma ceylanicum]
MLVWLVVQCDGSLGCAVMGIQRYEDYEGSEEAVMVTIVDPRYKDEYFTRNQEKFLENRVEGIITPIDNHSQSDLQRAPMNLHSHLYLPFRMLEDINTSEFLGIKMLAYKEAFAPTTSAECERL